MGHFRLIYLVYTIVHSGDLNTLWAKLVSAIRLIPATRLTNLFLLSDTVTKQQKKNS